MNLGIDLRGEEADEEVEDVNAKGVGDDVKALDQVHAEDVDGSHHQTPDPAAEDVRRRFVEHVLVLPRHRKFPPRYCGFRGMIVGDSYVHGGLGVVLTFGFVWRRRNVQRVLAMVAANKPKQMR